jgi:drug/metabolite transporter (DMT)-like permease
MEDEALANERAKNVPNSQPASQTSKMHHTSARQHSNTSSQKCQTFSSSDSLSFLPSLGVQEVDSRLLESLELLKMFPPAGDEGLLMMTAANSSVSTKSPSLAVTAILVTVYVLSGCSQPLLVTVLRQAGLADPSCQLYMLFYYLGPASAIFMVIKDHLVWPSKITIMKACGISLFDIGAQTMNYTGASMAGPTIFSIIYSSVTIWAALYSQVFLGRLMDVSQWAAVVAVFAGLVLTATDSIELGPGVLHGAMLVAVGSSLHGLFYVMSESVMTNGDERLSVEHNCAVQGITASFCFLVWQMVYTLPRFDDKIWEPMQLAGTSIWKGLGLLTLFALVSFLHSITFFHTLRHLPGGSTSAAVFKGLQAVLVFVFTDWAYCGRFGGEEMCFSRSKFISLVTVAGGVLWYGLATKRSAKNGSRGQSGGYERIDGAGPEHGE